MQTLKEVIHFINIHIQNISHQIKPFFLIRKIVSVGET